MDHAEIRLATAPSGADLVERVSGWLNDRPRLKEGVTHAAFGPAASSGAT
jgi:hypothetical protein